LRLKSVFYGLYGSTECHIADRFNAAHSYPLFGAGFFYVEGSLMNSIANKIGNNADIAIVEHLVLGTAGISKAETRVDRGT